MTLPLPARATRLDGGRQDAPQMPWPRDRGLAGPEAAPLSDPGDYYRHSRPEIQRLIPDTAARVLDVGCAAGALGASLKAARPDCRVVGIEQLPEAAALASRVLDRVLVGDAGDVLADLLRHGEAFDAIVFADVLEHLVDPWEALAVARHLLVPGGHVIASIPNLRNIRVFYRLVFGGDWTYTDQGILDRGHLRFFTRRTVSQAFTAAGFGRIEMTTQGDHDLRSRLAAALAALAIGQPHRAAELNAVQFLVRAQTAA